jgi:hypothetical protein
MRTTLGLLVVPDAGKLRFQSVRLLRGLLPMGKITSVVPTGMRRLSSWVLTVS